MKITKHWHQDGANVYHNTPQKENFHSFKDAKQAEIFCRLNVPMQIFHNGMYIEKRFSTSDLVICLHNGQWQLHNGEGVPVENFDSFLSAVLYGIEIRPGQKRFAL